MAVWVGSGPGATRTTWPGNPIDVPHTEPSIGLTTTLYMDTCTRLSLAESSGWSGSTHSSRLPLPLVSRMKGVQPCDFISSPVSSNIFRFSQPTTPGPVTPAEAHSVLLASSAKIRWCVGKQVEISVHLPVAGSYIDRCRL